ncbi:MAG: fatty acid desaturase [Saprospiraceae bacterium]|nr:fatty acid desaturase [Saprospiraceae bacterium]
MSIEKQEFISKVKIALRTLKEYQVPDHRKALIQIINSFGPFIGIWAFVYVLWDYSIIASLLLCVLNSFFLVRIFIIQHDCGHQTFVSSKNARHIIGYICSLMSSVPYFYWAKSHHFHHQNNGMLEVRDIGDIDTLTVEEFSKLSKFNQFKYKVYRSPLVMFLLGPIYYIFIHNRLPLVQLKEFKKYNLSLYLNNLVHAAFIVLLCVLLEWQKVLFIHFITLSLFSIIAIWFFYIQHQHEEGYKEWKNRWEFMYAAIKGSTYYKLPGIINWLTGNIAIHHIHHLNPSIPNYHLKKCLDRIPWFTSFTTQLGFIESLKLASHKLWDENQKRMISFREYNQMVRLGLVKI